MLNRLDAEATKNFVFLEYEMKGDEYLNCPCCWPATFLSSTVFAAKQIDCVKIPRVKLMRRERESKRERVSSFKGDERLICKQGGDCAQRETAN